MYFKFAYHLKKIRVACFRSQRSFASDIGVPIGTYPAWERGKFLPNIERVKVVCEALKLAYGVSDEDIASLLEAYKNDKAR